jgi:hypothetical protein
MKKIGLARFKWQAPYWAIAIVAILPLLKPGYIFLLDMVFGPHFHLPAYTDNSWPFYALLHILNLVVPADILQKVLLTSTLAIAGLGGHTLMRYLRPVDQPKEIWKWACYFAGTLYMVNPFVYSRFMTGQYLILLSYSLLPFFIVLLWRFCKAPSLKNAGLFLGIAILISTTSLHMLGLAFICGIGVIILEWIRHYQDKKWRVSFLKLSLMTTLLGLLTSAYWIIPNLTSQSNSAIQVISNFTSADQSAFMTQGEGLGIIWNILSLRGFWADAQTLYLLPSDYFNLWWIPIIVLLALVIYGGTLSWRYDRIVTSYFLAIIFVAIILAGRIIPLDFFVLSGYREPQKFVALLVFPYAYFGGIGLLGLTSKIKDAQHTIATYAAGILIPFLIAPLLLWGGSGQLQSTAYPKDWYTMKTFIDVNLKNKSVVFLPWHRYMPLHFTNGTVLNPAQKFFGHTMIISNDPEFKGVHDKTGSQLQRSVTAALSSPDDQLDRLRSSGVQYILLAKEYDHEKYDYLHFNKNATLLKKTTNLQLYEIVSKD